MRWWLGVAVVVVGVAAFLGGQASVTQPIRPAGNGFNVGYLAGREAAFGNYDGGWVYGTPYIVVLQRGGPGITYRIAQRTPMTPGVTYRLCGRAVCTAPLR
jgi:hypothetical protein